MNRYTYLPRTGQLKIKMATQIHAAASTWATKLISEGGAVGAWDPEDLEFIPDGRLKRFAGQYEGM